MSYSFNVRGATAALALAAVAAKLEEVAAQQQSHVVDKAQALAAATAFVELLPTPIDGAEEISVSISGSVGWRGTWGDDHRLTHAAVSVSAGFIAKEGAPCVA